MNGRQTILINSGSITIHGLSIPIQWIDVQVAGITVRQQNAGRLRASSKNCQPPIVGDQIRKTYRDPSCSARGRRVFSAGAWPQSLLWVSTGIKGRDADSLEFIKT
jgi:hypothetical protein